MTENIKDTLKILVGAAFMLFGVWDIVVNLDPEQLLTLIDLVFAIIGTWIGAPATIRFVTNQHLVKK